MSDVKLDDKAPPQTGAETDESWRDRVRIGTGSMHDGFEAQIRTLLDGADVSEEDRQKILTNMSCPCCGGSAASMTIKLKS